MNGRERIFAALAGAPVDRPAFTALLSLYGARLTECPLTHYYTDSAAYAHGQAAVAETFQPDILFPPFLATAEGEAFGSTVKYFDNQPPNLSHPAIASTEEIPLCSPPDVDGHPRLLFIREALRHLVSAHGSETAIPGSLLSPVDVPLMIMGIGGWLQTVLFDPDDAKRMLDITIPYFIKFANALLDDGADFLVIPAAFLNPSVVTRSIAEEFTLPILREVFKEVHGPIVLHHAGGPFLSFLDLYTGLPNVVGFVLDYTDSFVEAREKLGPEILFLGGLDGPNLCKHRAEEIEDQCSALLENRRDDARFVLATSGADVALETPPENIHALRRAVESFGPGEFCG